MTGMRMPGLPTLTVALAASALIASGTGTPLRPVVVAAAQHNTPAPAPTPTPAPTTPAPAPPAGPEPAATIAMTVNAGEEHQRIDGFGASHVSLWYSGGTGDVLGADLRARALDAVYRQVHLTLGGVEGVLLESPGSYDQRRNDDDNPFSINARGFQNGDADAFGRYVLLRPEAAAFDGAYPAQRINVKWASPWLAQLRHDNYDRYLNEAAEQVLAGVRDWRQRYGSAPRYVQLFNEPISGNGELAGGSVGEVVDLVKRVGQRLESEGFGGIQMIVPGDETVWRTTEEARALLDDPQARVLVGAIAYHSYPYGSAYADIPKLLATSGQGNPDQESVQARMTLRDLARRDNIPLWMTEVSHGNVDARSFDSLRGRAIHIHDELVYADASAYFGMFNMWDIRSEQMHTGSKAAFYNNDSNVVLVDQDRKSVVITGMGYAIGHYARWITRGAVRLQATTNDARVMVTAFRDDTTGHLVLVLINNRRGPSTVNVELSGVRAANFTGEQSTADRQWAPLARVNGSDEGSVSLTLPALSVTTISGDLDVPAPQELKVR